MRAADISANLPPAGRELPGPRAWACAAVATAQMRLRVLPQAPAERRLRAHARSADTRAPPRRSRQPPPAAAKGAAA
eukprot:5097802-Pleurochrysis_carterae.AAC.1